MGGRHGYGAKLTNIFSTFFEVETYDAEKKLLYRQQWENNMLVAHPPTIIDYKNVDKKEKKGTNKETNKDTNLTIDQQLPQPLLKKDYTKITFEPDLQRFGFTSHSNNRYPQKHSGPVNSPLMSCSHVHLVTSHSNNRYQKTQSHPVNNPLTLC